MSSHIKRKIDIIILSNCINDEIYSMNFNCLRSLLTSEPDFSFNVLVMESNKNFSTEFGDYNLSGVQVIIPNEPFNFNKFLNLGIEATNNEFIAFCYNDLIFKKGWFTNIYKASILLPQALSFCPKDPKSEYTKGEPFKKVRSGYRVREEFVGWCHIVKRKVFDEIPKFDEQFDFYFQDDDFALTLRKFNIKHYLVPDSHVYHLGGKTSSITDGYGYNVKANQDRDFFHDKWGSLKSIVWKNRISSHFLEPLKMNRLNKY